MLIFCYLINNIIGRDGATYRSIFSQILYTLNIFLGPVSLSHGKPVMNRKAVNFFFLALLPALPSSSYWNIIISQSMSWKIRHNWRNLNKQREESVTAYFYQRCFGSFQCVASFMRRLSTRVLYRVRQVHAVCCTKWGHLESPPQLNLIIPSFNWRHMKKVPQILF